MSIDIFTQQEQERNRLEIQTAANKAAARSRQLAAPKDLPHSGESDRPGHWTIKPADRTEWEREGWVIAGSVTGHNEPLLIMRKPVNHQDRR